MVYNYNFFSASFYKGKWEITRYLTRILFKNFNTGNLYEVKGNVTHIYQKSDNEFEITMRESIFFHPNTYYVYSFKFLDHGPMVKTLIKRYKILNTGVKIKF